MAIKVLHLNNEALIGRYPHNVVKQLFAEHDVDYVFAEEIPKGLAGDSFKLTEYCNQEQYDWLFWNWEKHSTECYQIVFESDRTFKIAMLGHEQPQALQLLRKNQQYADFVITTAPTYRNEVDGFLPFGIHTHYFKGTQLAFEEKQDRILISGSFRHSRGQFFEWLLSEQPLKWPVYLFTPPLCSDTVRQDGMRQIVSRYPKYVYKCADNHRSYITELLEHQNIHKLFLDFTTNSTNYLKFHEDFQVIMEEADNLEGGYCPERVLDALWLGTYSWCFYDKAVEYCLSDKVGYYRSLNDLVKQVDELIEQPSALRSLADESSNYVKRYTTEKVIQHLANFFHTGRLVEI